MLSCSTSVEIKLLKTWSLLSIRLRSFKTFL